MSDAQLHRRQRLRARLVDADLDALLVSQLANVRYLTGFTGSSAALLVTADGAGDTFVTDGRYADQAAAEVADLDRVVTRRDDWLPERLGGRGRLCVESHAVSWERARTLDRLLDAVDVVAAPRHVEALRAVKDAGELAALRRACGVADAAFVALLGWMTAGMSERDVAARLTAELLTGGADDRSFEPIVAAGENAARPHHRPTARRLAPGDLVTLDFGAQMDGYHSDMTRMVALGPPDPRLRDVLATVRDAQQAGLDAVTAGAGVAAVDAACRDVIAAADHGDRFVHATGHGVGLEVHEAPILRRGSDATLASGMAVTVEPGIYLPGIGGVRIEDTVAVTDGAPDVLSVAPKDLAVL